VSANPAQLRYLADAVSTATPAQRVVMLFDRLLLDIRRGMEIQAGDGDWLAGAEHLRHAQQIVAELLSSLRSDEWSGADNLNSIYRFVLGELLAANATPDVAKLQAVHDILAGLRDSFRAAVLALTSAPAPTPTRAADTIGVARPIAWVG
jgi:flagellar protein FliS